VLNEKAMKQRAVVAERDQHHVLRPGAALADNERAGGAVGFEQLVCFAAAQTEPEPAGKLLGGKGRSGGDMREVEGRGHDRTLRRVAHGASTAKAATVPPGAAGAAAATTTAAGAVAVCGTISLAAT
jgi:hypothetical protein